ncbi:MAG: nucleotide-binding domain containing protein, partial [Pseudomonadota bacterium]|nr:nucleotide-binding domain containing protein [Pseudomonadota bacterium]
IVEEALARLARAAFEGGVRRFVVAGGETSGAVARALDLARLDIGAEIAPGVPWTYARVDGEDVAITLKSGNFGDRDFFATALARLET